jgi:asparagine synthase (glutamine-hydrolysing)
LLFASERARPARHGGGAARARSAAVASFLVARLRGRGRTRSSKACSLLPAATILTIQAAPARTQNPRRRGSTGSCRHRRRRPRPSASCATLLETGAMQLVADVPLGVFLSGGSRFERGGRPGQPGAPGAVHTFTIGFDEAAYDESRVRAAGGARPSRATTQRVPHRGSFAEQLRAAFRPIDQPTFDGINTYFVSRAARARA